MPRMDWSQLLCGERYLGPACQDTAICSSPDDGRSPYLKDVDRIMFSGSFRRLGRKTQVHPLNDNDHIHTRLSHSLEVSCVGRSLGVMVGKRIKNNDDFLKREDGVHNRFGEIVQAACLAHDIGNPPFGHAGEEVIRHWFTEKVIELKQRIADHKINDFTAFDGNAMSLRVTSYAEYYIASGGMRLTYPTLGALLKYPWTSDHCGEKKKFSCLNEDIDTLKAIAHKLGLIIIHESPTSAKYARHPLAFLVEAADDICYKILDIEDAIELKHLPPHFLHQMFIDLLKEKYPSIDSDAVLSSDIIANRTKTSYIRGKVIGILTDDAADAFIKNYDAIMEGNLSKSLCNIGGYKSFELLDRAFSVIKNDVFTTKRKAILEVGAHSSIGNILSTFYTAALDLSSHTQNNLSYKTQKIKDLLGSNIPPTFVLGDQNKLYEILIIMLEYICGMTDHYATEFNRKILGLGN